MASSSSNDGTPAAVPASATDNNTNTNTTVNPATSANISIREYIYFLPYPLPPNTPIPYSIWLPDENPLDLPPCQFEPTSTVVLTSPNRTFIDVRVYKPFNITPGLLPNQGEVQRLDWAFAGTSSSVPVPWENVTHSTWTHWIDSRHPIPTPSSPIPPDEGYMYPIASDLSLEVGHAFHPALRAVKTHEEMWRDMRILTTNAAAGTKICIVLRTHADAGGLKGLVMRVGQYVQGMMVLEARVTVERWVWDGEDTGAAVGVEAGLWEREVRVGEQFLPCGVLMRDEVLTVGGEVAFSGFRWVVEECWEWM
ncbi:hypothetical protein BDW02DRAFT_509584 [Decorospora gaudefroyi]|uniref:Protein HRI1 n=1 Tax=Decorospora gaudefroyi TaxID=184978 RepID=A0A6A5K0D0_9PLEO|nr:hypothetical protein BDW02DRAFT_509584 [Decorospora gaudefroyi]